MIDSTDQLKAIDREVGKRQTDNGEVVAVLLRRRYEAAIGDVWDAITDPDRVRRWFLPLGGDLRVGGRFQFEGNAGGEILTCESPRLLKVSFGGPASLVELRFASNGDNATALELEHTVPMEMAGSGAGALYVGPGWDGALMALALFLSGVLADDPVAAGNSPQGLEFSKQSVLEWAAVVEASDTAGADEIAAAVEMSLAQFAAVASATEGRPASD